MMRAALVPVLAALLWTSVIVLQKGEGKLAIKKGVCGDQKFQLLSLLNLLCNNTQTVNIALRDSCYQCFFRTAPITSGATLILQLSQCAQIYLNNTNYAPCATQLASIASGARPTTPPTSYNCYTGYCEFVQCIRRVNTLNLVDSCLQNSLLNLNLALQSDRVFLYTNTTACILANTRCSAFNPITGVFQGIDPNFQANLGSSQTRPNSVQITPNGDVRIISLPRATRAFGTFCTANNILDQAGAGVCT